MDFDQVWNIVLNQIQLEVSKVNFNTWFKNTRITAFNNGAVTIGSPNQFTRDWLEQKYDKTLLRILRTVNDSVRSVVFIIVKPDQIIKKSNQNIQISNQSSLPLGDLYVSRDDGLNSKYTFDTYVTGQFNDVAYASAQAVINSPGLAYNPLFIYGNSGLGKTHLLQALGNSIKRKYTEKKIYYTSLEKFYTEFVNSMMQNKINQFKDKYRKFDVFIMDDVQFITNKDKTQDEIFHLFNLMHDMNRQIVFSADVHPNMIVGMDDRLRTRCVSGMVVDINTPSVEDRLAILKRKAGENSKYFEDKALEFIAETVQSSIRELEGVLTTLIAQASIKNNILTVLDVKALIRNNIKSKKTVSINEIVKSICDYYQIEESIIYSKTRRKDVVYPRQVIMYLLREEYNISYPSIGDKLGGRDHTTVIHSYEKIKNELKSNPHLNKEIEDLRSILV